MTFGGRLRGTEYRLARYPSISPSASAIASSMMGPISASRSSSSWKVSPMTLLRASSLIISRTSSLVL